MIVNDGTRSIVAGWLASSCACSSLPQNIVSGQLCQSARASKIERESVRTYLAASRRREPSFGFKQQTREEDNH